MKKTIAILSIFLTSPIFADSGCMGLANTTWSGQVKLINGQISPIQKIVITTVENQGGMFKLNGTIDGEAMTGMFGCSEEDAGKIAMVSFESNSNSLMAMDFAPDSQNPTTMNRLGGRWKGSYVDTTTDPSKNFIKRS
jgi:hypothetical protein